MFNACLVGLKWTQYVTRYPDSSMSCFKLQESLAAFIEGKCPTRALEKQPSFKSFQRLYQKFLFE